MALYRKYRPATFAEVVGQEHVTDPLSIALDTGRISHAYLFSGPRGCGKTSSARILARSLNCVQGPTSTPCGTCASCVALAPGGSGNLDVIELDAASHGGVDDTRELRDRAFYAPAESRYRVFIVDEAHMVTTAGFNALLKIVEEPPAHLIFIFATTEPDKVLPTIRSRTHHYPFRLLPPATMRGLLGRICEQERVPVEESVYPLVIRAGGGSPRDSLSVLDQLLAGAGAQGVTYPRAVALLGVTDIALIDAAIDALSTGDGAALFGAIDAVMEAGHDPRRFAVDLLERLRDLILLRAVPDAIDRGLVSGPGDVLDRMREQAEHLGSAALTRYAELLHAGLGEMRGATAPRLLLEVVCARMLLPAADTGDAATLQRLERLERGIATGAVATSAAESARDQTQSPAQAADPSRRRGAEVLAALRETRAGRDKPVDGPTAESAPAAGASSPAAPDSSAVATGANAGASMPEAADPAATAEPGPDSSAGNAAVSGGGRADAAFANGAAASEGNGAAAADDAERPTAARPESANGNPVAGVASQTRGENSAGPAAPMDSVVGEPARAASEFAPAPALDSRRPAAPRPEDVESSTAAAELAAEPEKSAQTVNAESPSGMGPEDLLRSVEGSWAEIRNKMGEFGPTLKALLSGASVARVDAGVIVFAHQSPPLAQRLSSPQNLEAVRAAVRAVLGGAHEVRWEAGSAPARATATKAPAATKSRGAGAKSETAPRFSRPSQTRSGGAGQVEGGAKRGAARSEPRSLREDDIPPPDFPDLPDDPGPGDYVPVDPAALSDGYAEPSGPITTTAAEEAEMLAEAATPIPVGERRDPDEIALELLSAELGATRLDG
ncbi:DNA polymerase III subunit gamma and tau [Nocardia panacis]|uniref:DNA polymerase III subunit gamma/tau n=1 Tax=Nocardia panacis TaxID=2340916 RepID=A0A3A4K964_9NOCA|nr:DNA polymerase III subunit gamma and tau [Nocardia panacis]RJO77987.1 DNA polymerase III subunit gamma and tau [Nocardia panacis]